MSSAARRVQSFWGRLTGSGPDAINPGLVIALGVIFFGCAIASRFFLFNLDGEFDPRNLLNIAKAVSVVGIAAAGETVVIISGGFDLSIGSTMAAAGMLAAYLVDFGAPLALAFAAAVGLGVGIGAVNGTIISYFRINPLIATLATLAIIRGIAFVISGGREIVITNESWLELGRLDVLGLPFIVIILVGTFMVFGWAMPRTVFGRYAYAIGSNARAARLAGVAVNRWRLAFYITSGATAAMAGLVLASRTGNARPQAALGFELEVITAVILGGASLKGGRGSIIGTLIALVLLGVVNNCLILMGVPSFWQQIVRGSILLFAVIYDEIRRGRRDET